MSKLTIVAHITAKPDQIERVKAELLKLIPTTLLEAGCLQYDLHQDNEKPAHFLFFESWESHELWQAHMDSQHLKDFRVAIDGALEDFHVHQMTPLS